MAVSFSLFDNNAYIIKLIYKGQRFMDDMFLVPISALYMQVWLTAEFLCHVILVLFTGIFQSSIWHWAHEDLCVWKGKSKWKNIRWDHFTRFPKCKYSISKLKSQSELTTQGQWHTKSQHELTTQERGDIKLTWYEISKVWDCVLSG